MLHSAHLYSSVWFVPVVAHVLQFWTLHASEYVISNYSVLAEIDNSIYSSNSEMNIMNAGGVIGTINCESSLDKNISNYITIKNVKVDGSIHANQSAGGIIGLCGINNDVKIVNIEDCTIEASIYANSLAGGVVGLYAEGILNIKNTTALFVQIILLYILFGP